MWKSSTNMKITMKGIGSSSCHIFPKSTLLPLRKIEDEYEESWEDMDECVENSKENKKEYAGSQESSRPLIL